MTLDEYKKIALSFPNALEKPHFDRISIRVDGKGGKMFTTILEDGTSANLPLNLEDQEMLCEAEPELFHPVAGKWGEKGWTTFMYPKADEATVRSALKIAWLSSSPKKLHELLD